MSIAELENRVERVSATMAMESMPLNNEEKNVIREINLGNISCDEAVRKVIKEYSEI